MNAEQAKFILHSYRPNGADRDDARFAEALAAARSDAELAAWFERDQALSVALSGKMREIPLPPDLKSRILAGAGEQPVKRSRRGVMLAMAAALVGVLLAGFLYVNRFEESGGTNFASFRLDMTRYLSRFFLLDYQSNDLGEVREWLATKHGFTDYEVPASLARHASVGCELIDWHGEKIALICFDVNGELAHLFVLQSGGTEGVPGDREKAFVEVGDWSTASWTEGERTYLVITQGGSDHLETALGV